MKQIKQELWDREVALLSSHRATRQNESLLIKYDYQKYGMEWNKTTKESPMHDFKISFFFLHFGCP